MKLCQYYRVDPLRWLVYAASGVSAFFLMVALLVQYGLHMHPCELCMAQRVPYGIIALGGLLAGISLKDHHKLAKVAMTCCLLFVLDGGIAVYHSGVEMGVFTGPSGCTNNDRPGQSLEEMRAALMHAQLVPCDQPMGYFLGLSMASWNALAAMGCAAGMFVVLARLRRQGKSLHG